MAKDLKLLGYLISDGIRYWTGERWRKHGKAPPKVYGTLASAQQDMARLERKRWDMRGVSPVPIRCP